MDWPIVHALNLYLFHHDVVEDPLRAYVDEAHLVFGAIVAVLFLVPRGPRRSDLRRGAFSGGLSAALALAVAAVVAGAVARARPFVAHPVAVHLFSGHAADPGFPSDHATASFAIATALLLRDRGWGLAALAGAALLSVGRVALGLHYPTDVLAGAALGAAVALGLAHPRARGPLDAVADRGGEIVDASLARLRGRVRAAAHR